MSLGCGQVCASKAIKLVPDATNIRRRIGPIDSRSLYCAVVSADVKRAFSILALSLSVVALWGLGMAVFAPSMNAGLEVPLTSPPTWQAAALWCVSVVLVAAAAPALVARSRLVPPDGMLPASDSLVPLSAGGIAWVAGWMDMFSVYDGLRPMGIAEHVAGANRFLNRGWWEWPAAYPGDPIKSVIVGFAGVAVVARWAWLRRWPDLMMAAAMASVALSVSAVVRDRVAAAGVLTSMPYDAAELLWGQVAITVVAGAALTVGAVMSCIVRRRRS